MFIGGIIPLNEYCGDPIMDMLAIMDEALKDEALKDDGLPLLDCDKS